MRVLEIGCGDDAGPYFDGASAHIILDINEEAVACSATKDSRFTPIIGDATDLREFNDQSVDVILARNIFGSPLLGIEHSRMIKILLSGRRSPDYSTVEPEVDARKLGIIHEAGRLLVVGGRIVIIEKLTPDIAVEFFERTVSKKMTWPSTLSQPEIVTAAAVTPPNYAQKHQRNVHSHRVWALNRH